jgi:hypothetical protein
MEPMLLSAPDVASIAKIDMLLLDSSTTYNVFPNGSMLAATGPTPSAMVNGEPGTGESAPVVESTAKAETPASAATPSGFLQGKSLYRKRPTPCSCAHLGLLALPIRH